MRPWTTPQALFIVPLGGFLRVREELQTASDLFVPGCASSLPRREQL